MTAMKEEELIQKKGLLDKLHLSQKEIQELIVAWLLLAVLYTGFRSGLVDNLLLTSGMILIFGSAFILHELAHKYAAIRFGGKAEYRLDSRGMIITVVSMLVGMGILVPGAVFWQSEYGRYSNIRGTISAVGPLTNLVMAAVFLTLLPFTWLIEPVDSAMFAYSLIHAGLRLNLLLGVFNMIPVWILDGRKVLEASTVLWVVIIFAFVGMYMFSSLVFGFGLGINLGFIHF